VRQLIPLPADADAGEFKKMHVSVFFCGEALSLMIQYHHYEDDDNEKIEK